MERNLKIDIAKGIGIFLMVFAHGKAPICLHNFIYAFHMPLFFILAGCFYNPIKYYNSIFFIKTRILNLLVPFLCFAILNFICLNMIGYVNIDNGVKTIMNSTLWFLPVLFLSEVIFHFLQKINKNLFFIIISCIGSAILGYLLNIENIHTISKLENSFMGLFFYGIGFTIKDFILDNKRINSIYLLISTGLFFIISNILPSIDMFSNNVGLFPLNQISAIIGTIIIIEISDKFHNLHQLITIFLNWAGKNTLTILGLSQLPLIVIDYFWPKSIYGSIYYTLGKYIFLWIFLYVISILFNKYLPFVVGKIKKSAKNSV